MSRARYHRHIDGAITLLLRDLDLADRPILIVRTLQNCDRNTNVGEIFADVPSTKVGIKPGVIPAVEGVIDVVVPSRKLGPQIRRFIGLSDPGDGSNGYFLDDEMRRDQHDTTDAVIASTAGIDRSDRGAVGMAEQHAALKADGVEQRRQHVERLAAHIVERSRQRDWRRGAVAGARIDEYAHSGGRLQGLRKISPQRR